MSRQPLSRGEVAFILGVPAAWAILLLFHPGGEPDTIYLNLQDVVDRFLVVHIGMLIFIPLFAAAVYVLMRDVGGLRRGSAGLRSFHSSSSTAPSRRCRESGSALSLTI